MSVLLLSTAFVSYQIPTQNSLRFSADEPGYSAKQDYKIQENLNKDVLLYQLCYLDDKPKATPISLIVSNVKVFLTSEYHQWPLPRLQAPLPLHLRGQHFQVGKLNDPSYNLFPINLVFNFPSF